MLYAIDHNTSLEDNLTLGVEIVGALRAMVQTGIVSVPALVAWCAVCRPFRTFSRFFFVFQEWVTSHHGLQSFRGGSHIVLPPSGHKIHIAVSAWLTLGHLRYHWSLVASTDTAFCKRP